MNLERKIIRELTLSGADGWCWAHRLGHADEGVGLGATEKVVIASMYKMHIFIALCLAFMDGAIDPRERIQVMSTDGPPGTPGISRFADPVTMSIRDLARQMMNISDSVAAQVIHRRLPEMFLQEVLDDAGLRGTLIVDPTTGKSAVPLVPQDGSAASSAARLLVSYPAAKNDLAVYHSWSTAFELCAVLEWLWTTPRLNSTIRNYALEVLHDQVFTHRIPSGFPASGVEFYGKTGTVDRIRAEVSAVVPSDEDPIFIAVVTRAARNGANLASVDTTIGRISRILVDELRTVT